MTVERHTWESFERFDQSHVSQCPHCRDRSVALNAPPTSQIFVSLPKVDYLTEFLTTSMALPKTKLPCDATLKLFSNMNSYREFCAMFPTSTPARHSLVVLSNLLYFSPPQVSHESRIHKGNSPLLASLPAMACLIVYLHCQLDQLKKLQLLVKGQSGFRCMYGVTAR